MKYITRTLLIVLFSLFVMAGCGGSDNATEPQAASIIETQADITETYIKEINSAGTADEVVAAIEHYTEGMKELIPQLKEFQEKYPEHEQGNVPENIQADLDRLEEISGKIPAAMMKMTSYMMDTNVQAAMEKMGQEMSKFQQN